MQYEDSHRRQDPPGDPQSRQGRPRQGRKGAFVRRIRLAGRCWIAEALELTAERACSAVHRRLHGAMRMYGLRLFGQESIPHSTNRVSCCSLWKAIREARSG